MKINVFQTDQIRFGDHCKIKYDRMVSAQEIEMRRV